MFSIASSTTSLKKPTNGAQTSKRDNPIRIQLQIPLNETYRNGRNGDSINYDIPPDPPLSETEQQ